MNQPASGVGGTGPTTLVIFGVSGDLAGRKLLPALYWLLAADELPEDFHIIGAARREVSVNDLIELTKAYVGEGADPTVLNRLRGLIQVVRMDSGNAEDYKQLLAALDGIEGGAGVATRLLYLSVPPTVATKVIDAFRAAGLSTNPGVTTRLLMEKPFGDDLASAKVLEQHLHAAFKEEQIYRIDHYVAKEAAQNIRVVRFQNGLMEAAWDHNYIDRIEVEASEKLGIEGRADFYEQTGALRDLIQSHLLALMALTMMEPPIDDTPASLHRARTDLIEAIKPIGSDEVARVAVRGQYDSYRQEVGRPDSFVETYARLELTVENDRWQGVPVILQTGKGLDAKRSEIRVFFKPVGGAAPDQLRFTLSADEGVRLQLIAKRPGLSAEPAPVQLTCYNLPDPSGHQPDGYERVLYDAVAGDQTNFTSSSEVLATWRLIEPVLQSWLGDGSDLKTYPLGHSGLI